MHAWILHTNSVTLNVKADTCSEIKGGLRKYLRREPGCILFYPELPGQESSGFLHRHPFIIGMDWDQRAGSA